MTDFICLGVPKSGTTTLYEVLRQHRQVRFPADGKNAYYYKIKGKTYSDFEQRYWGNVKRNRNKKYGIIAENWYGLVDADDFIRDFPKDIKIIFIIRNPIQRCYSEYKYTYAYRGLQGQDETDYYLYNHAQGFDRFIKNNMDKDNPIISCGKYTKICEFYRKMNPENIKVIVFEELIRQPQLIFEDLFQFLGIRIQHNINYNIKANEGKWVPINKLAGILYGDIGIQFLQNTLCWKYGINQKNVMLYKLFNFLFRMFRKLLITDTDDSRISEYTWNILYQYYYSDIKKTGDVIGKDLMELWFSE